MAEDDRFVEEYRPFVTSIAGRLVKSFDLRCELDDLLAFGFEGLLEAKGRFDPSRGVQFNTFAYYRVRGAILDGVRRMAYLPRHVHGLHRAAQAADDLTEAAGEAHAAAKARGERPSAARALDDTLSKMTASYVIASLGQSQEDVGGDPEEALIEADQAARLRSVLDVLPDRERQLVEGFYFEGRRFDHVAEELGISKSWASRLHTKALALLRDALEE